MTELLTAPYLEDAVSMNTGQSNLDFALEEVKVCDFPHQYIGIRIKDTRIREKFSLMIIGVIDEDGINAINPSPEVKLIEGQKIILIGDKDRMELFSSNIKLNDA